MLAQYVGLAQDVVLAQKLFVHRREYLNSGYKEVIRCCRRRYNSYGKLIQLGE